jgi:hypothetical protein
VEEALSHQEKKMGTADCCSIKTGHFYFGNNRTFLFWLDNDFIIGCGFRPICVILSSMQHSSSPHNPITSKDNSFIKHLRALSDPKHRKKEQVFLIEGVKMVEEALRDKAGATMVIASPTLVQHHGKGVIKLAKQDQSTSSGSRKN